MAAAAVPVGSMAVGCAAKLARKTREHTLKGIQLLTMQVAAGVDSIRLVGGRRVIGRSTVEPTYCAVCSLGVGRVRRCTQRGAASATLL